MFCENLLPPIGKKTTAHDANRFADKLHTDTLNMIAAVHTQTAGSKSPLAQVSVAKKFDGASLLPDISPDTIDLVRNVNIAILFSDIVEGILSGVGNS